MLFWDVQILVALWTLALAEFSIFYLWTKRSVFLVDILKNITQARSTFTIHRLLGLSAPWQINFQALSMEPQPFAKGK